VSFWKRLLSQDRLLLRLIRLAAVLLLAGVLVEPALELLGRPLRDGLTLATLVHWLLNNGLRVLLIIGLAFVVIRASSLAVDRFERYLSEGSGASAAEQAKRARTLGDMVRNAVRAFVIVTAGVMILGELGINTAPLLASAGIVGLAIGFGAQTLVKDVISGFFIILENQVRVGDVAEINGTGGLVEAITLRTLVLRDVRGAVHVFPCGSVNSLANLTKDYSYAVLDVQVDYQHDTDHALSAIRAAAEAVRLDPAFASFVLAPLEVMGIENLTDTGVKLRVRMKTLPQRQWDVARELRRRVKKTFDEQGIQIPVLPLRASATEIKN